MRRFKILGVIGICFCLLTACNSGKIDYPVKEDVKNDIQTYISELIDQEAKINYFQQNEIEEDGEELVITCAVSYESPQNSYKDEFILTYERSGKQWELSKCRVNTEYDGRSAVSTQKEEKVDQSEAQEEIKQTEEQQKVTSESEKAEVVDGEVSNELKDFTFQLEGIVYQLPVPYQVMRDNGWELDTYSGKYTEETELDANSYTWVYLTNGVVRINADIINMSGDTRILRDCTIGSLTIYAKNNLDFKVSKGIGCTSTKDEVEAAFGTPSSSSSGDGYQQMKYSLDIWQYTTFYFSENKIDNSIEIKNYAVLESDVTEVSDEIPEYLAAYKVPETLGDDVTEPVFELDGVLYRLPCPISVFTDNGWQIKSDSIASLGAGNHSNGGLEIQKGDYKLDLGLMNFSKKAALSKNCAVYQINIYQYKNNLPDDLINLPGGIGLASTLEEVGEVYHTFEKYEGTTSVSYTYNSQNGTKSLRYHFSLDPNFESKTITIRNENWDY